MPNFMEILNQTGKLPPVQPPQMSQVINPLQESTGLDQSPPKDEVDLQARAKGWQGFMEQLKTDPVLRNTMLTVGAHLLAGPQQMGENTGSIVGRAIQNGLLAHQFGRAQQAKTALAQAQEERAGRLAESQIEGESARTEDLKKKTAREEELLPLTKREKLAKAGAAEFQVESAPQLLKSSLETAASQRARNYALANKANRPAGEGSPAREMVLENLFRRKYPEATDQELASLVLAHGAKASKEDLVSMNTQVTALSKLIDSGASPENIKKAEEKLAKMLGLTGEVGAASASGPVTEEEFRAAAKKADAEGWFVLRGERVKLKPGYKP